MTKNTSRNSGPSWLTAVFLLTFCFGLPNIDASGRMCSTELPVKVKSALVANAQAMSILDIQYKVDVAYAVKGLPRPVFEQHQLYFENGKMFHELDIEYPNNATPQRVSFSYDGSVFYKRSKSGDGHPIVERLLGENEDDEYAKGYELRFRYLEAAGFRLPNYASDWPNASIQSEVLRMAGVAKSVKVSQDGNILTIAFEIPEPVADAAKRVDLDRLKTELEQDDPEIAAHTLKRMQWLRSQSLTRNVQVQLDSTKGFALRQRVDHTSDGELIQKIVCEDFEHTEQGELWLPKKCTTSLYMRNVQELTGFRDVPNNEVISVDGVSFSNRRKMDFAVASDPGSLLADRSTKEARLSPDGQVTFVIPSDNSRLRGLAGGLRNGRVRFLIFSVALFIAVVALFCWKNYRNREQLS